jgi:hypothetical protein
MYKSSLISLLKSLGPAEFKEFGELVHSPFFNKTESSKKLYDYLKKYYPSFEEENIEKEKVYANIFLKADYNDGFMRSVIFSLAALAEEYLKQCNLKKNHAQGELMLLGELNDRKLEKILVKHFPQAEKKIEELKGKRNEYYYLMHVYEAIVQSYFNWNRFKAKNMKDYIDERVARENKSLECYFLIKALSNYRLLLTKEENLLIKYNTGFLDDAIEYIVKHENEFSDYPAVILHVNEVLLLKHKKDEYYYRLKEFLNDTGNLTNNQKYSLHNILQNYLVYKGYAGEKGFLKERFELYEMALKNNYYKGSEDIYFDDVLFPNIAQTAMKLGELEWAENFIAKYSDKLSPDNRNTVTGYVTGRLQFVKGMYEQALKILGSIKSIKHHQFKVIIRNLILMVYYELSYYDQADALLASYRQYMSKNDKYFSARRFERQTDFIKYYGILLKLKSKSTVGPNDELTQVIVELDKNANVLERDWLIKKTQEIENKK